MRRVTATSRGTLPSLALVALVTAIAVGIVAPSSAAPAQSDRRTAFTAGYRTVIDNGTNSAATFRIPTADTCEAGDGSVTVQALVVAAEDTIGAQFTSACKGGSAAYSGVFLVEGSQYPVRHRIRGGDWITVRIVDRWFGTQVQGVSTRGWSEGFGMDPLDLDDAALEVIAAGDLESAERAGGLSIHRFRFIRVDGRPIGRTDPESVDDSCSSVTPLRRGLAFDTSFVC